MTSTPEKLQKTGKAMRDLANAGNQQKDTGFLRTTDQQKTPPPSGGHNISLLRSQLDDVYNILLKKRSWNVKDEELYSLIEKIIFLRAREETFRSFFDEVEKAVASALQLDFSKKVPVSDIISNKQNIFNYAALALNMIISKMEMSVVSQKAVSRMLELLPFSAVMVTDISGRIRFANKVAEKLTGLERQSICGLPVAKFLCRYKSIMDQYRRKGQLVDKKVKLIAPGNKTKLIPLTLTLHEPVYEQGEIDELVFIFQPKKVDSRDQFFNLALESHDRLAPLNSMSGIVDLLKKRFIDPESAKVLSYLDTSIQQIRQLSHDTLNTIVHPGRKKAGDVNLYDLVNDVLVGLIHNEGYSEVIFENNLKGFPPLRTNAALLRSIFQNLLHNAIRYRKPGGANTVSISGEIIKGKWHLIKVKDTGIGIPAELHKKVFTL